MSTIIEHSKRLVPSLQKYNEQGKKIKLKHLSTECQALLNKAGNFIEVDENVDPHYYIAH